MTDANLPTVSPAQNAARNKWIKPAIVAGVVVIVAILPLLFSNQYTIHILILTLVYIVAAVSLRTITLSGQFPMAHAGFMGIGAYAAGMASRWLDWSPWITIPLGAIAAGALGILLGYPFSRLRAMYYALGSLFFGVALISILQASGVVTGGYQGLVGVHPLFIGGGKLPYFYFFLGLTVLILIALYRFEFSRIGLYWRAIDQSHLLASSVGINERWNRILAVGVGCFFVGLIGAAFAHYNRVVVPGQFDLTILLWLVMYVLVGGVKSFIGPIIGTPILYLIPQIFFRDLRSYSPYIPAVILIIFVYLMPQGLVGLVQKIKLRFFGHKPDNGEKEKTLHVA
jgi:branched-chain amino acid transport system permease protein